MVSSRVGSQLGHSIGPLSWFAGFSRGLLAHQTQPIHDQTGELFSDGADKM